MPTITLRGERSLVEITDRLFVDLTPQQRRQVEAALLRANPGLREPRRFTSGLVVDLPELPELRDKARRDQDAPAAHLARALADALGNADKVLAQAIEAERQAIKEQVETLEALRRVSATGAQAELLQTAEQAEKYLAQREKVLDQRNEALFRAVRLIQEDLKAQAQRSG